LDIWFAHTTGVQGDVSSYYAEPLLGLSIPCIGTKTFTGLVSPDTTFTDVSFKVFNEEGNLIVDNADGVGSTTSENETLAAGDVVTLTWEMVGVFDSDFLGGVIVGSWNKSLFDDVIPRLDGVDLVETAIPTLHNNRGSVFKERGWILPELLSTQKRIGSITLDVDDTNDPIASVLQEEVVTFLVYDYDCVNDDNDQVICDVAEDPDDDTNVGETLANLGGGLFNITVD